MARKFKALVLDTWAILAYFEDEPAAAVFSDLLAQAHDDQVPLYMSVVNVCEVWYILSREVSESEADASIGELERLGITFVEANWNLARAAAELKSKHKMSLADCFAAALAKDLKADLVTGDNEFKQVEHAVRIFWLDATGGSH